MCNAATNSNRASLILDPFPSIVDPSNPHRLAMDPSVRPLPYYHLNYLSPFICLCLSQTKDFNQAKVVMTAIIAGREELLVSNLYHHFIQHNK